jgi:sulfate/thiosulfate transport system permease protein
LCVESLYNDYQFAAAFAVSSLRTLLAIATLIAKYFLERRVVPVKQEQDDMAVNVAA